MTNCSITAGRTRPSGVWAAAGKYPKLITPMNDRQQAHIDYFLGRVEYWKGLGRDYWTARMLAARDADHAHPLRSEEEGSEVFDYLRRLEEEEAAAK
jgi:hypothetical protein